MKESCLSVVKLKAKFTLLQAMEAQMVKRGLAPLFLRNNPNEYYVRGFTRASADGSYALCSGTQKVRTEQRGMSNGRENIDQFRVRFVRRVTCPWVSSLASETREG